MRFDLLCLASLLAALASAPAQAVVALPRLTLDSSQTTVSGLSSGAFMANQLGYAYASTFKGVGLSRAFSSSEFGPVWRRCWQRATSAARFGGISNRMVSPACRRGTTTGTTTCRRNATRWRFFTRRSSRPCANGLSIDRVCSGRMHNVHTKVRITQ